jgi:predicted membrane protein
MSTWSKIQHIFRICSRFLHVAHIFRICSRFLHVAHIFRIYRNWWNLNTLLFFMNTCYLYYVCFIAANVEHLLYSMIVTFSRYNILLHVSVAEGRIVDFFWHTWQASHLYNWSVNHASVSQSYIQALHSSTSQYYGLTEDL